MRDSIKMLTDLDLSNVSILAYSDTFKSYGTDKYEIYPENAIPNCAFFRPNSNEVNKSLTNVILPLSINLIGYLAFTDCFNLKSINIPSLVTSIGDYSFSCCNLSKIKIPLSVTSIEHAVFWYCKGTDSLNIHQSLISINTSAFVGCSGLIMVEEGNPIYSSIDGVLFNKTQTKLIHCPASLNGQYLIPSSVDSIGESAFENCKSLISIIIPSSVSYIGYKAFENCENLHSITIPSSIKSIISAFQNCSNLDSIYLYSISPPKCNDHEFNDINKSKCILCVPAGTKTVYQVANIWEGFKNIVEF